jgi:hypothetical protein
MCKKLMFLISLVSLVALVGSAQGVWCVGDGAVCGPADEVDLCDLYGPPPILIDDDFETCDHTCLKAGCDIHITGRMHVGEDCDQQLRIYSGNVVVNDRIYTAHDGSEIGRLIIEGDAVVHSTSGSSNSMRTGDNGGQPRVIVRGDSVLDIDGAWRAGDNDGGYVCWSFGGNCYVTVNEYMRIADDGVGEMHFDGGTVIVERYELRQSGRGGVDFGPSSMSAGEVYTGGDFAVIQQKVNATFDMSGGTINAANFHVHQGGDNGNSTLTMTGGLIIARNRFNCPRNGNGAIAHAQLDGGEVRCNELSLPAGGTIDITGGKLVINGNKVAEVGALACDEGRLTGYGTPAGVVIEYDAANDKTIVTAREGVDPKAAYCPDPPSGALAKCVTEDVILQWKGTSGIRDRHSVYIGTDCDNCDAWTESDPEWKGYVPGNRPPMWIAGRFPLKTEVCWRIDEVYYGAPTVKGECWSFICDCPPIVGDLNEDCVTNFEDYADMATTFGMEDMWP